MGKLRWRKSFWIINFLSRSLSKRLWSIEPYFFHHLHPTLVWRLASLLLTLWHRWETKAFAKLYKKVKPILLSDLFQKFGFKVDKWMIPSPFAESSSGTLRHSCLKTEIKALISIQTSKTKLLTFQHSNQSKTRRKGSIIFCNIHLFQMATTFWENSVLR